MGIKCINNGKHLGGFRGVSEVKPLPPMRETRVQFLGWEDPLEKNGNPLQHSCLENPMDGGA